jgi:MFS family permease
LGSAAAKPLHRDVWWIAFSAFFADLGYQMVIAGLPLFLVLALRAPVWVFGMTMALSYGPGAFIAYLGGRLGDRTGRRRVAILGNSFIPLLSLSGLPAGAAGAVALFAGGWWARNFRTPARRAMLTEVVSQEDRGRAFGLLHALDVGGGVLAALAVLALVATHVPFRYIFLLTALPLAASTACLVATRAGSAPVPNARQTGAPGEHQRSNTALYRGVIIAAALYGFSSYSLGFPILTVAQGAHSGPAGVGAYAVFLGVSALTGLAMGRRRDAGGAALALLGYVTAALGSLGLALAYGLHGGWVGFYGAVAVLGVAMGVVETLEPTLISKVTPESRTSGGMGALTAARSMGLLIGNLAMGFLYVASPVYSYGYASLVALLAAMVLLVVVGSARFRPDPASSVSA